MYIQALIQLVWLLDWYVNNKVLQPTKIFYNDDVINLGQLLDCELCWRGRPRLGTNLAFLDSVQFQAKI
jgi:hypothetical protein